MQNYGIRHIRTHIYKDQFCPLDKHLLFSIYKAHKNIPIRLTFEIFYIYTQLYLREIGEGKVSSILGDTKSKKYAWKYVNTHTIVL